MLFFSFFKTLVDQEVRVELKNDIEIKGTLKTVDQYLNLKLDNVVCLNGDRYPHMEAVKNLFIRGSTVRYVHMSANTVDCTLLQDASRRGMYLRFCEVGDEEEKEGNGVVWQDMREEHQAWQACCC